MIICNKTSLIALNCFKKYLLKINNLAKVNYINKLVVLQIF